MTAKSIQYLLASVFVVLGGWCLLAPRSVMLLSFQPLYHSQDAIVTFLIGGFGAQALIAGLFAALSTFKKRTFLGYGIALLPFFVFDYYFYAVVPMLTVVGLLDAVGNVVMLALCILGWRRAEP
jgi:hypothetical protein